MRFYFLVILTLIWSFHSCRFSSDGRNESINSKLFQYVKKTCVEQSPCNISLSEATDFSWDKFYVFDMAVENDVISKEIGKEISSTANYYSDKWFFLKDNHVILFEEHKILEVDKPIKADDVYFLITNSKTKFNVFEKNAVFNVERHVLDSGEFYILKCINCG